MESGSKSVASLLSEADLSPVPSPDYDAPSPEPDDQETELKLPDDDNRSMTTTSQPHPAKTRQPPNPVPYPNQASKPMPDYVASEQMSISEYLTKLAGQDKPLVGSNNGYYGNYDPEASVQSYYADPPPATAWPEPKLDDYHGQPQMGWGMQEEPVPEWQIQPEDEEPPDEVEIVEENLAMARLQNRNQDHALVQVLFKAKINSLETSKI